MGSFIFIVTNVTKETGSEQRFVSSSRYGINTVLSCMSYTVRSPNLIIDPKINE